MYIQANIYALRGLSYSMFNSKTDGQTKMAFKVIEFEGTGYTQHTQQIEDAIDFDYILVDEIPWEKDWFFLGGYQYTKEDIISGFTFHSKISRNLNTAMDVYFTFNGSLYGIRFQDWNIFNTLTDDQCISKVEQYILANKSISSPASPL